VLTLRSKSVFAGGILTGIGLSAYAFGLWIFWLLHHLVILGVSQLRVFIAIILLPTAVIATGVWLALYASKDAASETSTHDR